MKNIRRQLKKIKKCHGQSIIELTIAMAIFSLVAASLASLLIGTFSLLQKFDDVYGANLLIEDSFESIYSIKQRSWNEMKFSRSAVVESSGIWSLAGEGTLDQIGKYKRTIDFSPVSRSSTTNMKVAVGMPGSYVDPASMDIKVTIDWLDKTHGRQIIRQSSMSFWNSGRWIQTDWSGGMGQNIWTVADQFLAGINVDFSVGGQVTLEKISTSTFATNGTLESSAFKIDSTKNFTIISWDELLDESCSECNIKLQIKSAPDNNGSPDVWSSTWSGPDGDEDGDETDFFITKNGELINDIHNGDEWVRYRATLEGSTSTTPVLEKVYVWY